MRAVPAEDDRPQGASGGDVVDLEGAAYDKGRQAPRLDQHKADCGGRRRVSDTTSTGRNDSAASPSFVGR